MTKDPQLAALKGKKLLVAAFDNLGGQPISTPHMFKGMLTTAMVKSAHFKWWSELCLKNTSRKMASASAAFQTLKMPRKLGSF
jgi:hypothetical protein